MCMGGVLRLMVVEHFSRMGKCSNQHEKRFSISPACKNLGSGCSSREGFVHDFRLK